MSMKNSLIMSKNYWHYQVYSKYIVHTMTILIFLGVINSLNLVVNIESNYNKFTQDEQIYIDNGIDIEKIIYEESIDISEEEINIYNTLHFDYKDLLISIDNIKPKNLVSNVMEYTVFVFCTFIFGIYGIHMALYDFNNGTIKNKIVMSNKNDILISKNIVGFFTIFILLITICIFGYISSVFIGYLVDIEKYNLIYDININTQNTNIIIQFIFSYLILCLYFLIGFVLALTVKNSRASIIIFTVYSFLIPILGKYDLRNIIASIAIRIFTFRANFEIYNPISVDAYLGIFILLALFCLFVVLEFVIFNNRKWN